MMPGWFELVIIFGVILLLFGASRLPKIARAMGLSVGKFKEGLKEGNSEVSEDQQEHSVSKEPAGSDDATETQREPEEH